MNLQKSDAVYISKKCYGMFCWKVIHGSDREYHNMINMQKDHDYEWQLYSGYYQKIAAQEQESEKWYWDWLEDYAKRQKWTDKDFEYAIRIENNVNRPNLYSSAINSDIDYNWKNSNS